MPLVRPASAKRFTGKRVAIALNLHRCRRGQPQKKGEACFSVRAAPSSSSNVLGYLREVWLEDVSFFVRPGGVEQAKQSGQRNVCCFVVGTVIPARSPKVAKKSGWSAVRLDVFEDGCFYRASTGACVRSAKFARIRDRTIQAFGLVDGDPVTSTRQLDRPEKNPLLPIYGPRRRRFRGEMGGLNYEIASARATAAAIHWVLERHPGCVIVDGSDDWAAPDYARPHLLADRYEVVPVALWHTGMSGQNVSGVVLDPKAWDRFRSAYADQWGFGPEACPGSPPSLVRPACGCWEGEGLRIYRF